MALERIVATGLLGLGMLFAEAMPAYAQQEARFAPNPDNVIHCTKQKKNVNWGTIASLYGALLRVQNAPNLQKLGPLASTLGNIEIQKQVAREGRTYVNVNGQAQTAYPAPGCAWANSEGLTVRRSIGIPIAANRWVDFNTNGMGDDIQEFEGKKDTFEEGERILLVLYGIDTRVKEDIKWSIYYGPDFIKFGEGTTDRKVVPFVLFPNGNIRGDYTLAWSSEGITELKKFRIVEKK
mgnify:CR=1 FL=1